MKISKYYFLKNEDLEKAKMQLVKKSSYCSITIVWKWSITKKNNNSGHHLCKWKRSHGKEDLLQCVAIEYKHNYLQRNLSS